MCLWHPITACLIPQSSSWHHQPLHNLARDFSAWWQHPTISVQPLDQPLPQHVALSVAAAPGTAMHRGWQPKHKAGNGGLQPDGAPYKGRYGFLSHRKCPLHDLSSLVSGLLSLHFLQHNKAAPKESISLPFVSLLLFQKGSLNSCAQLELILPASLLRWLGKWGRSKGAVWILAVDILVNQKECMALGSLRQDQGRRNFSVQHSAPNYYTSGPQTSMNNSWHN